MQTNAETAFFTVHRKTAALHKYERIQLAKNKIQNPDNSSNNKARYQNYYRIVNYLVFRRPNYFFQFGPHFFCKPCKSLKNIRFFVLFGHLQQLLCYCIILKSKRPAVKVMLTWFPCAAYVSGRTCNTYSFPVCPDCFSYFSFHHSFFACIPYKPM